MLVKVSISLNIFESLTYSYSGEKDSIKPGQRVVVPLGNRLTTGWVNQVDVTYKGRVKPIIGLIREPYFPHPMFLEYVNALSLLYLTSAGMLLDSSLSPKNKSITSLCFEKDGKIEKLKSYPLAELLAISKEKPIEFFFKTPGEGFLANEEDISNLPLPLPSPPPAHTYLLDYSRVDEYKWMISQVLRTKRSVLLIVPDNLTARYWKEILDMEDRDDPRNPLYIRNVQLYNSDLKPKDKESLWHQFAIEGKIGVVIGGLSAVMLPIKNLGLVLCDRDGSKTYRYMFYSHYHVNVLAKLRAQYFKIPFVQGFSSFTTSVYSLRSSLHLIDNRTQKNLEPVRVHAVAPRVKGIPGAFIELLETYHQENKKILVILNKKESSPFLFCGKCKTIMRCPACGSFIDATEEFHITCKRCKKEQDHFQYCPKCNDELAFVEDVSVASVGKAIKKRITETPATSISSEVLAQDYIQSIRERIETNSIVIATPAVVNPFFKDIFDVIVYFRPESYFDLDEYDAAEGIFSLVSEFRDMIKDGGSIEIFSTFHFHYALKSINEEDQFFEREMKYREWFHLPPFSNVYHVTVKAKSLRELGLRMREVYIPFKESLCIKKVYLLSRTANRGVFKGIIELHAQPLSIKESRLLENRDIEIRLELV